MWLVDRSIRVVRRSQPCPVLSVTHHEACRVTQVTLGKEAFDHYAGQFAFVCFPQISHSQWHPFTVSSAPSAACRTFHIKSMGSGTFTDDLAKRVLMADDQLLVRVDGPYGRPPPYEHHRWVRCRAAGIAPGMAP